MFIDKGRLTELYLDAQLTESLLRVMPLNDLDDGLDSPGHFAKVNRFDFHRGQPEALGIFHQMIDMSGLDQGFAGNATVVQAVPPELFFFLY